jgi:hypothetical protein
LRKGLDIGIFIPIIVTNALLLLYRELEGGVVHHVYWAIYSMHDESAAIISHVFVLI